ncbi:hypothetical protein [Aurantivibrio infirmus]
MRRAILFLFTLLIVWQVTTAEEVQVVESEGLVGWWEEYSPSSNIIRFSPDGIVKLMLKKGEIGNLRSLDGTWEMSDDGAIQMVFSANGKTLSRNGTIIFVNDEMILIDENGSKTKHRRTTDVLPEQYVW